MMPFGKLIEAVQQSRSGGELWFFDSTSVGDKDTQCSWGLCCRSKDMWPDPETRMWDSNPVYFADGKMIVTKYRPGFGFCPMDRRGDDPENNGDTFGCFYRCRIFNPQGEKRPNRERALELELRGCEIKRNDPCFALDGLENEIKAGDIVKLKSGRIVRVDTIYYYWNGKVEYYVDRGNDFYDLTTDDFTIVDRVDDNRNPRLPQRKI